MNIERHQDGLKSFFEQPKKPLFIIGPCSLQDEDITRVLARKIKKISDRLSIDIIFKGSYVKANRTKYDSFHGVGIEKGLELLEIVKDEFGLKVTSDVHETSELAKASKVLDLIQIPADLCKHTSLLFASAETGLPINIKKGMHVTSGDMEFAVEKIKKSGNEFVMLTERGTMFGYTDIIVDFRSIPIMKKFGVPVLFDASHSVRKLSLRSEDKQGATPEYIPMLSNVAATSGADGLFLETHISKNLALSDASSCTEIEEILPLLVRFLSYWEFTNSRNT